ncbi:uncharacterized protein LOC132043064 [Lycium ferocissimum]|uniref:uncharacterized protein LOC132043064 n=1 Tax=Lycium ferocissimum TaxID=112874 RepID=UPI0028166E58|nr:uncharacterized protein LOC132043064 [Lycium ferocissimum]
MDTNIRFGGKVVVFGGDFRQTLPIVRNGKKEDFINESLLYSDIWEELERLPLSENMRAKADPQFCDYLMRIGNRQEKDNSTNKIEIPDSFIIPFTTERESLDKLFTITYPNMHTFFSITSSSNFRVILTTKNDFINEINDMLIAKFPGTSKTFVGIDETIEPNDQYLLQNMEYRHNINEITPQTREWTCKVQLIEKARARHSKDGRIRFQIMIAQDETEEQVAIVLYGNDIGKYEKKLYHIFDIKKS